MAGLSWPYAAIGILGVILQQCSFAEGDAWHHISVGDSGADLGVYIEVKVLYEKAVRDYCGHDEAAYDQHCPQDFLRSAALEDSRKTVYREGGDVFVDVFRDDGLPRYSRFVEFCSFFFEGG